MMSVCFVCDSKLYGECTQVCSNITPHSYVPYPEKIAELMGDEVVVIVTPDDHMCKKCTSLLIHMDKLENDLKLVKNAMLYYIQKKYKILPPNQTVQIVNGHLKAKEQLELDQHKVTSGLTVRVFPTVTTAAVVTVGASPTVTTTAAVVTVGGSPTVTTAAVVTPVQIPLKLLKTQQQQQQKQPQLQQKQQQQQQKIQPQQQQQQQKQLQIQPQQQQQRQHQQCKPQQQQHKPQQQSNKKMCEYKCGFCSFQSKELGHVRFHIRIHKNKKKPEKPILNQAAAKALTPVPKQKRLIYRCPVCAKVYNSSIDCVDHIQENHKRPTPSTSNGKTKTEDSCPITTKFMKVEPFKTQKNNQQADSMDVDENQLGYNKGAVDMDMMLNDGIPTEGSANIKQEKETENTQEDNIVEGVKLKIKLEPAQVEEKEDEEDTAVIKQEESD